MNATMSDYGGDIFMELKVINAGNCVLCKRPIKTVDCDSGAANIFVCKECAGKMINYNRHFYKERL